MEHGTHDTEQGRTERQCRCHRMTSFYIKAPKTTKEKLVLLKYALVLYILGVALMLVIIAFGIDDRKSRDYILVLVGSIVALVLLIFLCFLVRLTYLVHKEGCTDDTETQESQIEADGVHDANCER